MSFQRAAVPVLLQSVPLMSAKVSNKSPCLQMPQFGISYPSLSQAILNWALFVDVLDAMFVIS